MKCPHCGKPIPKSLLADHHREAAKKTGQLGGLTTAKKGSAYFRKIASMRWHRGGGRPKKSA